MSSPSVRLESEFATDSSLMKLSTQGSQVQIGRKYRNQVYNREIQHETW